MEEKRSNPFCNIYDLHCKNEFTEIKQDVKEIKRALLGENGDYSKSLVAQTNLNTGHRLWMEGWGRVLMTLGTTAAFGFLGTLVWLVVHSSPRL